MTNFGYIPSQFMIDEQNARLARYVGRPDPQRRGEMAMIRRRMSGVLRTIADRLDPSGIPPHGVNLVVMPYPGDAGKIAARRRRDR
jgi:hypothetical protein